MHAYFAMYESEINEGHKQNNSNKYYKKIREGEKERVHVAEKKLH